MYYLESNQTIFLFNLQIQIPWFNSHNQRGIAIHVQDSMTECTCKECLEAINI